LRALCNWGVRRAYLPADPLASIATFDKTPKHPHRELTEDEVHFLLQAAPAYRNLLYRTILGTGYRAGEIREVRVHNLDPFGPSITLAGEFTKNRKPARQPITKELELELREHCKGKADSDVLFYLPHPTIVGDEFFADLQAAEIQHVIDGKGKATFHSLRVNYINSVVESGADLKTVMTLARHGSAAMSMETYAKPKPERLRAAAEAVAEQVKAVESGAACSACVRQENEATTGNVVRLNADKGLSVVEVGSLGRTRTYNPAVNSRMLYH